MTDRAKQYQQLIAKCWADDAFKQRLLADPAGTLKTEGIEVPEGVRVQVTENTALAFTLVIPARPTDLVDEDLAGGAGGGKGCDVWEGQYCNCVWSACNDYIPAQCVVWDEGGS